MHLPPAVQFLNDDGLAIITLSRPQASNSITPDLVAGLADAIEKVRETKACAVLLVGEGDNFCVGADLKYLETRLDRIKDEIHDLADAFHGALASLAALPVPVVAAVQGNCVGAGWGLALAADILVASDTSRFSAAYSRLGLSADAGVSYFLCHAVGPRKARSLLMTSQMLSAADASALGLIDRIVPVEALAEEGLAMARRLASGPTAAFATIKRLTDMMSGSPSLAAHLDVERDEIAELAGTPYFRAAIEAFLKRSLPR